MTQYIRPDIAAIRGYTPGEQLAHSKIIKLNTNENPFRHSSKVDAAVHAALEKGLSRYPDPTASSFRLAASSLWNIPPDWILCGNGSDDILTIVTRSLVGAGDSVRLPYPSYILYRTLAELQGANSEEIHFNADWSLPAHFEEPKPRLKLVYLPNPNSPSGTVVDRDAILRIADSLDCPLLVDEAYADFAEFNCVDLVRQNPKIMVSRTLSKSYALAGLRFGYLVAQPELISEFNKVKDSYNCDGLSIAGATAALCDTAWLAENIAKIRERRAALTVGLRELGFSVVDSQANFVWCENPRRPSKELYEELKARQVLVRYMNYPGWGDGLRITVGDAAQIEVCLRLLKELL